MKKLLLFAGLCFGALLGPIASAQAAPFLATFQTANAGDNITLPLIGGALYVPNFTVDWGDGSPTSDITTYDDVDRVHIYATAGNHQISITGTMPMWNFLTVPTSKDQIISIDDAGDVGFGVGVPAFVSMFEGCKNLTSVALFDTSSGISFQSMFNGASSLTSAGLPLFDTSSGEIFQSMFQGASSLDTIPLFDTSAGTKFGYMFRDATSLTSIPLLNTSTGQLFNHMFFGTSALSTIPLLNTSKGTTFRAMFYNSGITTIPAIDTSAGTKFDYMFYWATNLTSIPTLNTTLGDDFSLMFRGANTITNVTLSGCGNGTTFKQMFTGATALESVSLNGTNSGSDTDFTAMFQGASSLTSISGLDTSSGTIFNSMFHSATSLVTVPDIDTSNGTDFWAMFYNMTSLVNLPAVLNTSNGTNFEYMFGRDPLLTSIPLIDVSQGTIFAAMFASDSSLTQAAMIGTRYSVDYSSTAMAVAELRDVFTNIGTAAGAQTLNITGNPGQPELTAQDYADVMAKGWEVIPAYVPTAPVGGTCANLTTSYFEKFFYHDNPQISAITTALKDYQYYDCDNKIFRKGNASQQMEDISLMLALRLTTAELATMNTNKTATEKQSYYDTQARVFKRGLADGSLESVSESERMLTAAEIAAMTTAADGDFYYNMTTLLFYIGKPDGTLGQLFTVAQ